MAELFEVQKAAISKHLKNIFESGELQEESVVSKMETTAADGKRYNTNYYNLDAIIAVGYRVNSKKATMFRIWANLSADYDVDSPITKEFFATVQNKLHYAVTHHTAAEIIYGRADSTKPNMGLTTWKMLRRGVFASRMFRLQKTT